MPKLEYSSGSASAGDEREELLDLAAVESAVSVRQGATNSVFGNIDKGWYVADLDAGLEFAEGVFVVGNVRFQERGNAPKLTLTIRDVTGERKAKCWQVTDAMRSALAADAEGSGSRRLYKIAGSVDDREGYAGEILLKSITSVHGLPRDLRPYLEILPENHQQVWDRFKGLLRSVRDPHLYGLLKRIFVNPTLELFRDAVAAQSHHHAYRGGLLEHSVEVAELCRQASDVLPDLSRDLLVTGALLHDIGKLDEMGGGLAAGEFTDVGTLHGHTYMGVRRIERAIEGGEGFPRALSNALLHMVLSHHGCAAYGAATPPAFGEAVVLSQCDLISARAFACRAARSEAVPGQSVVWRSLGDSNRVFTGSLGTGAEPAIGDAPSDIWSEEELSLPEVQLPPASRKHGTMPAKQNKFALSGGSGATVLRLPLLGSVAAGDPERSGMETAEEEIVVVAPPGGADFLVRVNGDSMIGAGIFERDLLIVRRQEMTYSGEIVVAYIPGEGQVVKRLWKPLSGESGAPELRSENAIYKPIKMTEGIQLQGKVVGLHRNFA